MYSSTVEINLDSIGRNVGLVRSLLGEGARLCAVMKSDAYGLGIPGLLGAFAGEGGADFIGVARFQEALEIKRYYPRGLREVPLFIMGLCDDVELPLALDEGFVITLDSLEQGEILSREGVRRGRKAPVHIKIDTGFSRLGLRAADRDSRDIYERISRLPGLRIEGTFSHLALADAEADGAQFRLFQSFCDDMEGRGVSVGMRHICDSIGTARYPAYHLDMVRAGAILYGMKPFRAPLAENLPLEFPVRWETRITHVTRLGAGEGVSYDYSWKAPAGGAVTATIPVGYGDGYPRSLSRGGRVLVGGLLCPVIGLICMDQMVVDVSAVPSAQRGDRAVLLGEGIDILDLAEGAGTNRNEILARLGRRVLRRYWRGGKPVSELAYLDEPAYREL